MLEEIEIWKSLDFMEYPNYQVSNMGRIKSLNYLRSGKEKILKQGKRKDGYLYVILCKNGVRKNFRLHKLVALAFLKNPQNLPQINHKDENKQNNHVSNLEFCTHEYNCNYGTRNERVSKTQKEKIISEETKKKISKPILQFTLEGVFIREWQSATSANKELKINRGNITQCCQGKLKTSGGYIWRYKDVA